jgi:hypothetical protein
VLTAEARVSVGTTAITDSAPLGAALANWQAFMLKNLPVRLKTK